MKYVCAILVAAACVGLFCFGCNSKIEKLQLKTDVSKNETIVVGETDFAKETEKGVSLVFAFDIYCSICAKEQKEVNNFADKYAGKVKTIGLNCTNKDNGQLVNKLKISLWPMFLVFVDGKEVYRTPNNNYVTLDGLEAMVKDYVQAPAPVETPKEAAPAETPKEAVPAPETPAAEQPKGEPCPPEPPKGVPPGSEPIPEGE